MRIIMVQNGSFQDKTMGGGERFVIELSRRWCHAGHEVHIVVSSVGKRMYMASGIRDCIFHTVSSSMTNNIILENIFLGINSLFVDVPSLEKTDVIISSDYLCDVLLAYKLKLEYPKVKWAATVWHIVLPPANRPGKLLRTLLHRISQKLSLRLIGDKADLLLTENSHVRNVLGSLGVTERKVMIVSGGVDLGLVKEIAEQRKVYDACYLGRIQPKKGIFDLVKIWKIVCKERKNAKLAIMGGGERKWINALHQKIMEEGLQRNVSFLGFVSEDQKFRVLKASNIFVFPSYEEGWPIVFFEAMACGLPIIAYFIPTYRDRQDAIIKVRCGNIRQFAETLLKTLSDEGVRNKYIESGKKMVKKLDWDEVSRDLLTRIINQFDNRGSILRS
ncbi:MAG: glycosyltransferase family 4 protein [Candidatus Baldrarchaeia archaeon]